MQAVIPLAGKGTRLRPLTHTVPKPLVRVANRPVLDHVLEGLVDAGVDEIIGVTGYLGEEIEAHMERAWPDLPVRYVEQERQIGTADAVGVAREHVDGPVLVLFVDTLFDADLEVIWERPEADGIIWAYEVEDPSEFGVIMTDDDGYMERIVEKPREPVSNLANIGVQFIRDHELLFEGIEHVMADDPHLGEYFLTDALQYMVDRGARIYTAPVRGWWDCGKPETLLDTNRVLLERGRATGAEGRELVVNHPVCVADDVRLDNSELGPNVSVGEGSVVRDSRLADCIVGRDVRIEGCDLRDSLVGAHARVRGIEGRVLLGDHSVAGCDRSPGSA
jgi:glucose-1-phosphate thymidylyltransferase